MNIFQKQKSDPETLSEWLDVATKKLSVPAEARIRSEIESHFVEAVDDHMQSGLSEPVAHLSALEQLGDPKAAGRRFRRYHLTTREARLLAASIKDSKSVITLLTNYGIFIIFAMLVFAFPLSKYQPLCIVLEFFIMAGFPTVAFGLLRTHESKGNVRRMLLLRSVSGFPLGFYVLGLFVPQGHVQLLLLWSCAILCLSMADLTIWRKLRRVRGDWADVIGGCKPAM
jgi:hypothetical protein